MTNAVIENIKQRRSIRRFKDEVPDKDLIDTIIEAGTWAPSGKNMQTWQFTVLRSAENISRLNLAVGKALGNDSYNIYGAPVLIILSNKKDNTNGLADCSAAIENMFLAAESIGVSSCWINQLKITCDDPEVRKLLSEFGVPEDHHAWCSAAIGFAASRPHNPPERKPGTVIYAD